MLLDQIPPDVTFYYLQTFLTEKTYDANIAIIVSSWWTIRRFHVQKSMSDTKKLVAKQEIKFRQFNIKFVTINSMSIFMSVPVIISPVSMNTPSYLLWNK